VFLVVHFVELGVGCFGGVGDSGGDEEEAWGRHFSFLLGGMRCVDLLGLFAMAWLVGYGGFVWCL